MCRVCTRLASLTARGATALLRSCSAPQALGHSAHGGAAGEALQRWCHTSALRPPFVTAQARRHLRPSSTFTAVSHSPRGFACRTKFDAPPPKMVRFLSSLWFHSAFRRVLTLALCRATRCWWSMTPMRWTASSPWLTPSRCAAVPSLPRVGVPFRLPLLPHPLTFVTDTSHFSSLSYCRRSSRTCRWRGTWRA